MKRDLQNARQNLKTWVFQGGKIGKITQKEYLCLNSSTQKERNQTNLL